MNVENHFIPPGCVTELEGWMLATSFTAAQAERRAREALHAHGQPEEPSHRFADRMIQKLRKDGKIAFKRVKGKGTVWSPVS